MFKVWGAPYEAVDATGVTLFQPIKFNQDCILRAFRTWVILNDGPQFSNLHMKIYSDDTSSGDHAPGKLLHTSTNNFAHTDIATLENGVREIYFEFNYVNIQGSTWYNLVMNFDDYAPAADTHLAWRKAFPDPVYRTGLTVTINKLQKFPYAVYAIGAEF